MLGLIQAVLQTEASASRATQQLLAEEDQAAASAAAKKAKKKQRQKARKQLTHNEVASVEKAPVESTAAPAVVTTFTQAAADCTHSNQLTDAHTSPAAATAAVDVLTTSAAVQPSDARKTIGSVATSQGQASKDEQHDAAFLQSLFCCPILKLSLQHLLGGNAASKHHNPVAVSYTSLPDAHICTLAARSMHPAVTNHTRCMSNGCQLFDGKYTAWQYKCLSVAGQAAMLDPVIAADGHTYERVAMDQWLQHHDISPVTKSALAHTRLVPNVLIRKAIACQQQQQAQESH